jgi:hypothetical protein
MALKGERKVIEDEINLTCESVAEAGTVLCYKTAGSGVATGDRQNEADLYANPSGKVPAAMLMVNVVSVDETRYHRNFHNLESLVGEPAYMARKGRFVTNKVTGTPTVGATAYLTASGVLTPTLSTTGGLVATPKVGQFSGVLDENGYASVDINLPVV